MQKFNLEKHLSVVPSSEPRIEFDSGRYMEVGKRIKIDYSNPDIVEVLSKLSTLDIDWLKEELARRKSVEETLSTEVADFLNKWEEQAKASRLLMDAIEIVETARPENTNNKWETSKYPNYDGYTCFISNKVYKMYIRYIQQEKRTRSTGTPVPEWVVGWHIALNSLIRGSDFVIHGQEKKLSEGERAESYVKKIQSQYAYCFATENPPIPRKYAHLFSVNGVLLPGYILESETETLPEAV